MNDKQNEQNYRRENVIVSVPVIDFNTYNRYIDDPEGVKQTLDEITWDLMAYPVVVYRKYTVNTDANVKGTTTIGTVNGFDKENNSFIISLFNRFEDTISEFEEAVVMPRVIKGTNGRSVIVSLIVAPKADFDWMLKPRTENRRSNTNHK